LTAIKKDTDLAETRMTLSLAALLALGLALPCAAQTLGEKLSGAARKAATQLDQTITSTVDLAKGEATPELTRQKLDTIAQETLDRLFLEQPQAQALFDQSAGYAVFDSRRSVLLGITAGFGRGVAVEPATGRRVYMRMATGGVGLALGLGGFQRQIVILFETPADFERFVTNGYDATADSGAMVGDETRGEEVRFVQGRSIFILSTKGWKVSATAAGTRYWKDPALN
jgi:hypothetical protein